MTEKVFGSDLWLLLLFLVSTVHSALSHQALRVVLGAERSGLAGSTAYQVWLLVQGMLSRGKTGLPTCPERRTRSPERAVGRVTQAGRHLAHLG